MALAPFQYLGPKDKVTNTEGKKGGGGLGQILGTVAAGGAVLASGGLAAAPLALGAAGLGGTLGGFAGDKLDPGHEASQAIDRRIGSGPPQMLQSPETAKLHDALTALQGAPMQLRQEYSEPLLKAYITSAAQAYGQQTQQQAPQQVAYQPQSPGGTYGA